MKVDIPSLEQFSIQAVDEVHFTGTNQEVKYSVDIEPRSLTSRVVVALVDHINRKGMAIAIYPATGEVCDVLNGEGVIGYLGHAPLNPNAPISCELKMFRFGRNFVCNAIIEDEIFLYPAFFCEAQFPMAAMVGKERINGETAIHWDNLVIETHELDDVIAA